MPSFIPEHTYGLIPGSYRDHGGPRYGLIPWPTHLRPRGELAGVEVTKKGGACCAAKASLPDIDLFELFGEEPKTVSELPALAEARGVFFLTLTKDRTSIATTIERLIDMLDAMDGDPDIEVTEDEEPYLGWPNAGQPARLQMCDDHEQDNADSEPWLGAPELHPASFEAVFCGVLQPRSGFLRHDCSKSQAAWAAGGSDDREDDGDDKEPDNDAEFSLGWENEGSQATLRFNDEQEPELGWTEHVDQTLAGKQEDGAWMVSDGEEDLGFVGHDTGWRECEGMEARP